MNIVVGAIRTNSKSESWHAQLKGLLGAPHPDVLKINATLKQERARAENEFRMTRAGQKTKRIKTRARRRK